MLRKLIAVIIIACLCGCISFRSYDIQNIDKLDFNHPKKKKTNIFLDWDYLSQNMRYSGQRFKIADAHKKLFTETFSRTGCCSFVDDQEKADVVIKGNFIDKTDPQFFLFVSVSGYSFGVIPSWGNWKIKIEANAIKNKKSYSYEIEDSMFVAIWLPFIVAVPFDKTAASKELEMNENMYKNLFVQMNQDKIFGNY